MSTVALAPFEAWNGLALTGFRLYASSMRIGCDAVARLMPAATAFPAPAVRRSGQVEMWPMAGSFGGSNAVAAWVDATQAVLGAGRTRAGFDPLAWMMPASPWPVPWLAAVAPWWHPTWAPWASPMPWPMAMLGMPYGGTMGLANPFRIMAMMSPMLEAFAPPTQRSFRYH